LRPGYLDIVKSWNQLFRTLNPSTKTGRSRYIPIPAKVEGLLEALIQSSPWGHDPEHFLFYSTASKEYPIDGKRALDGLKIALGKIGITEEERRARYLDFHSWRHWFNSLLINAKVPLQKVMAVTGHITPEMAANYYHADDMSDVRRVQESFFQGGDL
ncbi:MAG TPA: hypothetical protein ENN69_04100, partial [Spirochaetia bacterium]|nr:hypothetical protein [Spirochaetia bacterium]